MVRRVLSALLLFPALAIAQWQGNPVVSGSVSTSFTPYTISSALQGLNFDWDMGQPGNSCGQVAAATYNIQQNLSNPFGIRFESRNGDVSNVDCALGHTTVARTELYNFNFPWPLNATTTASADIWGSYYFMIEPGTSISSNFVVVGQLHAGQGASVPAGVSPAFALGFPACQNEATPTGTTCPTGSYGNNFAVIIRQCEGSANGGSCSSNPAAAYVYNNASFVRGQYYSILLHVVYSQAGCTINTSTLVVGSPCFFPGGTSCSNTTCGQVQVWLNGVQIVNYTGIIVGYSETSCPAVNPTPGNCPYFKFGIYRQQPPAGETVIVHYNNVQFSNSQPTIYPVGLGQSQ